MFKRNTLRRNKQAVVVQDMIMKRSSNFTPWIRLHNVSAKDKTSPSADGVVVTWVVAIRVIISTRRGFDSLSAQDSFLSLRFCHASNYYDVPLERYVQASFYFNLYK